MELTLLNRYRNSIFIRNVAKISSGRIVAQAVSLAALPIISRMYNPDEFGWYAIFLANCSILGAVATLSLHSGIVRSPGEAEANDLFSVAIQASLILHIVLIIMASVIGNGFIGASADTWCLVLIGSFLTSILASLQSHANYRKKYSKLAQQGVVQALAYATFAIATPEILVRLNLDGGKILATAYIVGMALSIIRLVDRSTLPLLFRCSPRLIWQTMRQERDLVLFLFPATWIDMISSRSVIWMLGDRGASEQLGSYHLSDRTLSLPLTLVGSAVAMVFTREANDRLKISHAELRGFIIRIWAALAAIALIPLVAALVFSPVAFSFIFGESWRQAGEMARWLSIAYFFRFISAPTSSIFLVARRLKISLILAAVTSALRIVSVYVGWVWGGATGVIIGFSIGEAMGIMIYNAIGLWSLSRA